MAGPVELGEGELEDMWVSNKRCGLRVRVGVASWLWMRDRPKTSCIFQGQRDKPFWEYAKSKGNILHKGSSIKYVD